MKKKKNIKRFLEVLDSAALVEGVGAIGRVRYTGSNLNTVKAAMLRDRMFGIGGPDVFERYLSDPVDCLLEVLDVKVKGSLMLAVYADADWMRGFKDRWVPTAR